MTKRAWRFVTLGVVCYIGFALVTVPAGVLLSRLESMDVRAVGVTGTAWKGNAAALQVGSTSVGAVSWDLHVLPLFMGRLQGDVKVTRPDGFVQARIQGARSGTLTFNDLTASLPLASVGAGSMATGWNSTINIKLSELALTQGWPVRANGTIEVIDLTGPANRPANVGSYKLTFPAASPSPDTLVGALQELNGPLQVAGTVQMKNDRSYVIEGNVAARPDAPRSIVDALQYLGAPDPQGNRPFSIAGTM